MSTSEGSEPAVLAPPVLRIVSGHPDAAEIAAVTVALLSIGGGESDDAAPAARAGGWADRGAQVRRGLSPAPGGWRASTRW